MSDNRVRRHFRFPLDLAGELDAEAEARGVSANHLTIVAVRDYLFATRTSRPVSPLPASVYPAAGKAHRHKPAGTDAAGRFRCACGAHKLAGGNWAYPTSVPIDRRYLEEPDA